VTVLRIVDERPDWQQRSVLRIESGAWVMRNGHIAEIKKQVGISYRDGSDGKSKVYTIWVGTCTDCNHPMTWTLNGCYAAVGRHQSDIVGRADPLPPSIGKVISANLEGIVGPETARRLRALEGEK
jgi:hypothetical protein